MVTLIVIELISLIIFLKFADFNRFRELVPIIFTGIYLRFLEHYIVIDWLELWHIHGAKNSALWLPISADLTVWPIVAYFYIQYLPSKRVGVYTLLWSLLMFGYLQLLFKIDVVSIKKGWHPILSALFMIGYFTVLLQIWKWLRGPYTSEKTSRN
ncbi:hypothetical protein [Ammoniphilus sp. CFH 90114]|uniref:hypothetical protein n=1 Tax=Ammoniphilus sp. CFH 90114 TaxID=2493665 RepID=UPI00100DD97A|nr:hypothetical protein [Ammoniphilus sp. CFH 90114]RXT08775.1 hypothetical protein EIZ39_08190 [Ammoniphilus sp. CFH 90114]